MADTVTAPEQPTPEQVERITSDVAVQFMCFGIGSSCPDTNPIGIALAEKPACFAIGVDVADVVRFVLQHPAAAQRAAEAVESDADAMSERNFVDEFRPIIDQLLDLGREVEDRGLANEDRVTQSALAFLRRSLAATPPPGDAGERARFEINRSDVGSYVRRKSTGQVGHIERDPGNNWMHPSFCYEWQAIRDDFEYVSVLDAAALQSERTAAASEIENLQSDLDNLNTYSAAQKQGFVELCAAIGVERGHDNWPEFITRVKAHIDAAASQARRETLLQAVDIALSYDVGAAGHSNLAVAHNAAMNIAGEIRRALATPQESGNG